MVIEEYTASPGVVIDNFFFKDIFDAFRCALLHAGHEQPIVGIKENKIAFFQRRNCLFMPPLAAAGPQQLIKEGHSRQQFLKLPHMAFAVNNFPQLSGQRGIASPEIGMPVIQVTGEPAVACPLFGNLNEVPVDAHLHRSGKSFQQRHLPVISRITDVPVLHSRPFPPLRA